MLFLSLLGFNKISSIRRCSHTFSWQSRHIFNGKTNRSWETFANPWVQTSDIYKNHIERTQILFFFLCLHVLIKKPTRQKSSEKQRLKHKHNAGTRMNKHEHKVQIFIWKSKWKGSRFGPAKLQKENPSGKERSLEGGGRSRWWIRSALGERECLWLVNET